MEKLDKNCPVCNSMAEVYIRHDPVSYYWKCPVCGKYEISECLKNNEVFNDPKLASYLFYNRFEKEDADTYRRYHTTKSKEQCDRYRKKYEHGDNSHGFPVHMDRDVVQNWYPDLFSEKIDDILLKLEKMTKHIGEEVKLSKVEMFSLLFVEHKEYKGRESIWRDENECEREAYYMINFMKSSNYIMCDLTPGYFNEKDNRITIAPMGFNRIDELQKRSAYGSNVLVAMKFGDDTLPLRESIRKGIINSGYNAIFIDEVQHNDFITPELLKYIRDSKFVVADLSHQNNGAYFEEGYAMGLGKPVIQLCKKDVKLHFDIAQKNTIMWVNESDIPQLLENRIKATID